MRIVSLAERPDLTATLAQWHFAEWADLYPDWTLEACQAELRSHTDADRLPTTLVAVDDAGEALGSVSLVLDDLPGWEHLSPWLASLFVRPDQRGRGVGSSLLRAAIADARRLGVAALYLYTPFHEGYYAARGWAEVARTSAGGRPVVIMTWQNCGYFKS